MSDADVAAMDNWMAQPEPEPEPYVEHAFPIASDVIGHAYGMSMRDYFAGQVIAGSFNESWCVNDPHALAKEAYAIADAMMSARKQ